MAADVDDARAAVKVAQQQGKAAGRAVAALEVSLPTARLELESLRAQVQEMAAASAALEANAAGSAEHDARLKALTKELSAAEKEAVRACSSRPLLSHLTGSSF